MMWKASSSETVNVLGAERAMEERILRTLRSFSTKKKGRSAREKRT